MSRREVKQSIRSQVMIVFFLPLVVAVVHIAVAFKVITKLLSLMNLTNVSLFMTSTIITSDCVCSILCDCILRLPQKNITGL